MEIAEPLRVVIEELSKLPSIGRKSAQRLALHLVKKEKREFEELISALNSLKDNIKFCQNCFNITSKDICSICDNPKRSNSIICVVEEASDVIAIESTNEFHGKYHVLGGVLSPLSGVGVEDLKIITRLARGLPIGGDLEFADEATIGRALLNRINVE